MKAVAGRGRITPNGWQPENHEHIDALTEIDGKGRRIGKDPGAIPLETLSAAGHPAPARLGAATVVARMNEYGGEVIHKAKDGTRLTHLRDVYCFPCRPSEGFSDAPNYRGIRECSIIDCPCWPYRLGFNPHNPQRGKNPFAVRVISENPVDVLVRALENQDGDR